MESKLRTAASGDGERTDASQRPGTRGPTPLGSPARPAGPEAPGPAPVLGEACAVPGADLDRVRLASQTLLDDTSYAQLAETFRVLADSSRAKIVHCLLRQELCTCDLAAITGLSEPAVSQHLRLLRSLRLVKTRRDGKKVYYSLDDAHVRVLLNVSLRHLAHEAGDPLARGLAMRPHPDERGVAGS